MAGTAISSFNCKYYSKMGYLIIQEKKATTANFMDTLVNIFPTNMWVSFSNAEMLQVIVIALFFGGSILAAGEKANMVRNLVTSLYAVIERLMEFIISLSPIGVFTMMAWVVATQGSEILGSLATCCGFELTLAQMVTVVVTATLASIGTAGTPGAGMIMLAMVLVAVGIPVDMIMIIYGIDRLFDMGRTCLNITGDISCALCVTKLNSLPPRLSA